MLTARAGSGGGGGGGGGEGGSRACGGVPFRAGSFGSGESRPSMDSKPSVETVRNPSASSGSVGSEGSPSASGDSQPPTNNAGTRRQGVAVVVATRADGSPPAQPTSHTAPPSSSSFRGNNTHHQESASGNVGANGVGEGSKRLGATIGSRAPKDSPGGQNGARGSPCSVASAELAASPSSDAHPAAGNNATTTVTTTVPNASHPPSTSTVAGVTFTLGTGTATNTGTGTATGTGTGAGVCASAAASGSHFHSPVASHFLHTHAPSTAHLTNGLELIAEMVAHGASPSTTSMGYAAVPQVIWTHSLAPGPVGAPLQMNQMNQMNQMGVQIGSVHGAHQPVSVGLGAPVIGGPHMAGVRLAAAPGQVVTALSPSDSRVGGSSAVVPGALLGLLPRASAGAASSVLGKRDTSTSPSAVALDFDATSTTAAPKRSAMPRAVPNRVATSAAVSEAPSPTSAAAIKSRRSILGQNRADNAAAHAAPRASALPKAEISDDAKILGPKAPSEDRKTKKNTREKQRRLEVNERFAQLAQVLYLAPSQKSDKVSVLDHAIDTISQCRAQILALRTDFEALLESDSLRTHVQTHQAMLLRLRQCQPMLVGHGAAASHESPPGLTTSSGVDATATNGSGSGSGSGSGTVSAADSPAATGTGASGDGAKNSTPSGHVIGRNEEPGSLQRTSGQSGSSAPGPGNESVPADGPSSAGGEPTTPSGPSSLDTQLLGDDITPSGGCGPLPDTIHADSPVSEKLPFSVPGRKSDPAATYASTLSRQGDGDQPASGGAQEDGAKGTPTQVACPPMLPPPAILPSKPSPSSSSPAGSGADSAPRSMSAYGSAVRCHASSVTLSQGSHPRTRVAPMPGEYPDAVGFPTGAEGSDGAPPADPKSQASGSSTRGASSTPVPPLRGKSLMLFGPDHPFRRRCANVVRTKWFDAFILVVIFLSSILLAVDNPLLDPDSTLVRTLNVLDIIMTVVFTVEMVMKIVTWGFLLGPDTYLRSGWNVLDFLIVIVSILSLSASGNSSLKSLRSLRTLRALRPLRVISRRPGLRLIVNALFKSIKAILNVAFVCILFFLIFGIVGVNYFKGSFNACQGEGYDELSPALVALVEYPRPWALVPAAQQAVLAASPYNGFQDDPTSRDVCLWISAALSDPTIVWDEVIPENFDNVFTAMQALFEMATTEGWVDVMYAGVDARGIDMQPKRDANPAWVFFFMVFMVVGSFFVLNLFVGVVIDNFNTMKESMSNSSLFLTDSQREWVKTQRMMHLMRPIVVVAVPKHPLRRVCFRIAEAKRFEVFIMACIILNTLIMAIQFFGQPDAYSITLEVINYIFALIFTAEAAIKLIAMKLRYFNSNWNTFDFLIVVGTIVGIVLQLAIGLEIGSIATVVRTFRVGRVFRLVKRAKTLQNLFHTVLLTLPSLGNIGGLLFLLFFIYAVMGVQLYAPVMLQDSLDVHANFQGFWRAVLTLMRASTGESWNFIMYDLAKRDPTCIDDILDLDWEDKKVMCGFSDHLGCEPIRGCGSASAYPYFLSFTLLITFVFLNLFIAVILEGSGESEDDNAAKLSAENFHEYAKTWAKFDPEGTGHIKGTFLGALLRALPEPMGFAPPSYAKRGDGQHTPVSVKTLRTRMAQLDVHIDAEGELSFWDVATALAKRVFEDHAKEHGSSFRVPPSEVASPPSPKKKKMMKPGMPTYSLQTYFAARTIQTAYQQYRTRNPGAGPQEAGGVPKPQAV